MPVSQAVMSRRARVVVLAVAVWLVAVTGTTTLAWLVIDRAGRSIGSTPTAVATGLRAPVPARPSTAAPSAGRSAPRSDAATSAGHEPARTPAATSRSATASTPGPRPTGSEPVVPVVPAPGSTSPTRRPTTRPTGEPTTRTPAPTAATAVQRAVHVQGGEAAVRCTGATIALRWAQPDDGWAVETGASGPTEVEVVFRSSADGAERETQVHAVCQRGAPVLEVETRGSSEG